MKILIPWFKYPPFSDESIGGMSLALWNLTHSLANLGVDAQVICPRTSKSELQNGVERERIKVLRNKLGEKIARNQKLSISDLDFLKSYDWIFSINNFGSGSLRDIKPRIVRQIHTIAHDRPVSTFVKLQSNILEYARMYFEKQKEMSAESSLFATQSICVSNFNLKKMLEFNLENDENLIHIPNGIDTKIFKPMKEDQKYDISFIGRFQKLKGLDILLDSINNLYRNGIEVRVAVVGHFSNEEKDFCLQRVLQSAKANIKFLGLVRNELIPKVLRSSRMLVIPSRYESFSLPALEAISCGVPVVASALGGIPELVGRDSGILVNSFDGHTFARSITKVLSDDSISERCFREGPQKALRFDNEAVATRVRDFMESKN